MHAPEPITLGILAGGRATRLGGIDKAWLRCGGEPQVLRLARMFTPRVAAVLVSDHRTAERYAAHGLRAVPDRVPEIGPLGGIDALAQACATPWLLTLPVDILVVPGELLNSLAEAGTRGAYARDEDGVQPLIALWPTAAMRPAVVEAIERGDHAIHVLQSRLGMRGVRFAGPRFGNLNTPDDLAAAGIDRP